jgi:hypothetical protein
MTLAYGCFVVGGALIALAIFLPSVSARDD